MGDDVCGHEDPKHPGRTCIREPHTEGRHRYPRLEVQVAAVPAKLVTIHAGIGIPHLRELLERFETPLYDSISVAADVDGNIVIMGRPADLQAQ